MNIISLEEAKEIKLMNRVEKKYICTENQLYFIINLLHNYSIVSKDNMTEFKYKSVYFDTNNLVMWNNHNDDVIHRQKIRIREYSSGEKFLEIKDKNKEKDITYKTRIPVNSYNINNEINWISENLIYDTSALDKTLEISYNRITLINKNKIERITIDKNICFYNYRTNIKSNSDNIIIEIKQSKPFISEFEQILLDNGIKQIKFSKYYKGILMTRGT